MGAKGTPRPPRSLKMARAAVAPEAPCGLRTPGAGCRGGPRGAVAAAILIGREGDGL